MSAIQLQIMSDLHLELPKARPQYDEFEIEPQCPYLALLGDIGQVSDSRLFEFLNQQLQQFETVLYLLGNHEPYGTTFTDAKKKVREFQTEVESRRQNSTSPRPGKFIFLDQTRYDISSEVTILGCTLFSSIVPEQRDSVTQFVSDFSNISNWTADSQNAAHNADLQWLNAAVSTCTQREPHRSIVILTHYSPTILEAANDSKHVKDEFQIRSAFTTDLLDEVCWTSPQVEGWAFGHTHFCCDVEDPRTGKRVVANQRGYGKEGGVGFDGAKVVEFGGRLHSGLDGLEGREDLVGKGRAGRKLRCAIT